MAVTRWDFPSGTDGDTLATTLAGSHTINSAGGTSVIDTDLVVTGGTRSALMTKTTTGHHWFAKEGLGGPAVLAVDAYVYFHSLPTVDTYIVWIGASSSARNLGFMYRNAAADLRVIGNSTATLMSGFTPSLNTWYRLSLWLDRPSGQAAAAIYAEHGTTPLASAGPSTLDVNTANPDRVRIGPGAASNASVWTISVGSWAYDADSPAGLLPPAGSGGSTDYDETPDDPAGITDSVTADLTSGAQLTPADAAGITDQVIVLLAIARTISDNVFAADSDQPQALAIDETIADTLGATDSATRAAELQRTPADTAGATDAAPAVADVQRAPADALGVTDGGTADLEAGGGTTRTPTDAAGIADAATFAAQTVRAAADLIGVTDSVTIAQATVLAVADAIGVTDGAVAWIGTYTDIVGTVRLVAGVGRTRTRGAPARTRAPAQPTRTRTPRRQQP